MRTIWLVLGAVLASGDAHAGDLDLRLDRMMEYESRAQRADMDVLLRQQALDAQDARDHAARREADDAIARLERGPLPTSPAWTQH